MHTREGETTRAPLLKTQSTTRLDVLTVDARDGQPLQGLFYVISNGWGTSRTRIEHTSGAEGHAILNVPVGKVALALASNVSTPDIPGKPRISAARTSRGPHLNENQATIQIEEDAPISYKGVNSFTVTANQTRHITIRLMPIATP